MQPTLPENCWRSEAFAEDLVVDDAPPRGPTPTLGWLSALPLAVAVLGVAFALWPAS